MHQLYFYPWGTRISWPTPSALLLIPIHWGDFTRRPHFLLSRKDPLFCVKTSHITKRPHRKLPHFCHEKTSIPFLVDFVTERPLLFKCLMYVSLYKSCAPGYLHPLSILSQSTSVSPTDVLPIIGLLCRVNDRAVRAEPFARKAFRVNYTRVRITHA